MVAHATVILIVATRVQVPLRDMVLSNPDLGSHILDRCYARDAGLSEAYFHVFAGLCTHLHAESSNGWSIAGALGTTVGQSGAFGSQSGVSGDAGLRSKGVGAGFFAIEMCYCWLFSMHEYLFWVPAGSLRLKGVIP